MKNLMKNMEKALKGALLLAMLVVVGSYLPLTGFAANTYSNTSYDFTIKVEHVFKDHNNGHAINPGEYNPRDDLIDELQKDGQNGLKAEINKAGDGLNDDGEQIPNVKDETLDGTESGRKLAEEELKKLYDKINNNKDTYLQDYKKQLDALVNPDDQYSDENPAPTRPADLDYGGITPMDEPVKPVEPTKPDKPEPPQKLEDGATEEEIAKYKDDFAKYEEAFKTYNDKYFEYTKEIQKYEDDKKQYDLDKAEYDAWYAENGEAYEQWCEEHAEEIEAWENATNAWRDYKNAKSAYTEELAKLSKSLREWLASQQDASLSDQMYDENLKQGFEERYSELIQKIVDGENLNDVVASLNQKEEELGNKWESKVETYYGAADIDDYLATLDQTDEAQLKLEYDGGTYKTSQTTTVVRVEYLKDKDGKILKNEDGTPKLSDPKTYKSVYVTIDGKEELRWQQVDANGNEVGNELTTAEVKNNAGRVTSFTFTFVHEWTPPDIPNYEGEYDDPATPELPNPITTETTPPTTPPPTPTPSTSVPPEETEVLESEPPLAEPSSEPSPEPSTEIEIPPEEIPLTGDLSYLWYAAASLAAAGLLVLLYQERRSKKSA